MGKRIKTSTTTLEFDLLLDTIREARESARLSQRQIAARLEMEATTVGRIERGTRSLDVVEFVALARAIGVDPLELLGTYLIREQQARLDKKL